MKRHAFANTLLIVTVLILVSTAALVTYCKVTGQTNRFELFGFRSFMISSSSMEPAYKKYSTVITKKVPKDEIHIGDVIAYWADKDTFIFHRVVDISHGSYTTQGDKVGLPDGKSVEYKKILGKEFFHTNIFVNFFIALSSPFGFFVYFIAPIFSIILLVFGIKYTSKTLSRR